MENTILLIFCVFVAICVADESPLVIHVYTFSQTPDMYQDRVVLNERQVILDAGSYACTGCTWNAMTGKSQGAYQANPYVFENMDITGQPKIQFMPPCAGAFMFRYCDPHTCVLDAYLTVEGQDYLPPVANFTVNSEFLYLGSSFILNATGSSDPQGAQLTYLWEIYQVWPETTNKSTVQPWVEVPLWTFQTNDSLIKYTPTEPLAYRIFLTVYNGYISYTGRLGDFVNVDVSVRDPSVPSPMARVAIEGDRTVFQPNETIKVVGQVKTVAGDENLKYYWIVEVLIEPHVYGIYGFYYFPQYNVAGASVGETYGAYSTNGALPNALQVEFPAGMVEYCAFDANWNYSCTYNPYEGDYQVSLCADDGYGFAFDTRYCSKSVFFKVL